MYIFEKIQFHFFPRLHKRDTGTGEGEICIYVCLNSYFIFETRFERINQRIWFSRFIDRWTNLTIDNYPNCNVNTYTSTQRVYKIALSEESIHAVHSDESFCDKKAGKRERERRGEKDRWRKEDVGRKIGGLGWPKKNSLVIDASLEPNQPLSRVPSTYHQCNSYNVSTQPEPAQTRERRREEIGGEGECVYNSCVLWDTYIYRREAKAARGGACTKGTPTMRNAVTNVHPRGVSLSLSLSLFSTPVPHDVSRRTAKPSIMYSPLFIRISKMRVYVPFDRSRWNKKRDAR